MVIEFGDAISPEINRRVHDMTHAIEKAAVRGVFDLVPTYRSLLVYYDPTKTSAADLRTTLEQMELDLDERLLEKPRVVHIPTLYGGEYGPDLEFVAENAGLTTQEVIKIHSEANYLVYAMGFTPGFPYLGGLSEKLTTPRLESPRLAIPAGSVGIAESQTGVYPAVSPGGWRLIGRTPVKLFDQGNTPPALLSAGDYLRFVPIEDEQAFQDIQQSVESGEYEVVSELTT